MSKHTPGPWSVDDASNVRAGEAMIAQTYRNNIGMSVREELANARLIAAAPELLEVLEDAVKRCKECLEWVVDDDLCAECVVAAAVIRKARGEA